jgi:hypothetical protein
VSNRLASALKGTPATIGTTRLKIKSETGTAETTAATAANPSARQRRDFVIVPKSNRRNGGPNIVAMHCRLIANFHAPSVLRDVISAVRTELAATNPTMISMRVRKRRTGRFIGTESGLTRIRWNIAICFLHFQQQLGRYMNEDFMKPSHAGKEAPVPIDFLNFALGIGGAGDQRVIVCSFRSPVVAP